MSDIDIEDMGGLGVGGVGVGPIGPPLEENLFAHVCRRPSQLIGTREAPELIGTRPQVAELIGTY